jgi:hypothetical protein
MTAIIEVFLLVSFSDHDFDSFVLQHPFPQAQKSSGVPKRFCYLSNGFGTQFARKINKNDNLSPEMIH